MPEPADPGPQIDYKGPAVRVSDGASVELAGRFVVLESQPAGPRRLRVLLRSADLERLSPLDPGDPHTYRAELDA